MKRCFLLFVIASFACLTVLMSGCGSKSAGSPVSVNAIVPGSKAAMYHAQDPKSVGPNGEYADVAATQKLKMRTDK